MNITSSNYFFSHSFWKFADWIYPPTCCGCGKVGYRFCDECLRHVETFSDSICICCGETRTQRGLCSRCRREQPHFVSLRSWGIFSGPLRDAVHSLKYHRNLSLGDFFSPYLFEIVRMENWQFDAVAAIPLNKDRFKERGYNQAEVLARPLANLLKVPIISASIVRVKKTQSQVGLSLPQRKSNVENAFLADHQIVNSKKVLIVDDVATTGSTIDACSQSLLDAGAKSVFGLTLARALKQTDDFMQA